MKNKYYELKKCKQAFIREKTFLGGLLQPAVDAWSITSKWVCYN